MSDIVERLRELKAVESELAWEGDCPPEATANYRYAMTCAEAADTITALRAENASLAAWQCVYTDGTTGLVADEHGHQHCAMAKKVEALRAENERLRAALRPFADKCGNLFCRKKCDEGYPSREKCFYYIARTALEGRHE